ncbi:hypothetical protein [Stenotrophomonas sp. PS02289]|uniref:hypothetical protein n=1 Tax=Stenotrophomonas sp. PS02289 TaxID=2991422 RepID=UPI00249AD28F|nr:hypothetical protein [Stenotrophomonas sp. PS02289]
MKLPDDELSVLLWVLFEEGLWIAWITTPIWWPVLRVVMQRGRLPHPLAYIAVAAALGYGFVGAVMLIAFVPLKVTGLFLVPQLLEAGIAAGEPLHAADRAITGLMVPLIISLPFTAIFGSITLNRRWRALCGLGLQENVEHR